MLMISFAKGAEMLAAAVSPASFNIGNALGAFLGGLPLFYGASYTMPELVGAAMSLVGAGITMVLWLRSSKNKLNNCQI
ncbi:MAG: transporter [Gammaproteobacteria bacterium]|jgi:DHA1 family arabinose polymer transporter-like MFS transporter|nr:transporter [Gammaproteobacteria bacterium]